MAPRTPIERELVDIWAQVFGTARIGVDDNFFEIGGHSLRSIELIARVEKRFGRTLPAAILFQAPTVAQMAEILDDGSRSCAWSSMIQIQPRGRELPFFWIHGDSSNACLPDYLGHDRPLYALEHQAHDGRPARFTEVETIAEHYLAQVRAIRPHGPYLLGGYSFGAVVAFEMAQQLQRAHEDVSLLFMLDPPTSVKASRSTAVASSRARLRLLLDRRTRTHVLPRLIAAIRSRVAARTARLTRAVKRARWKVCLLRARPLPPSLRSPYILDVYKRAFWSYVPRRYSGRVMIFKDQQVSYGRPYDWSSLASGPLEIHEGRGHHMEMTKEPLVAKWAAPLKDALAESSAPRPLRMR